MTEYMGRRGKKKNASTDHIIITDESESERKEGNKKKPPTLFMRTLQHLAGARASSKHRRRKEGERGSMGHYPTKRKREAKRVRDYPHKSRWVGIFYFGSLVVSRIFFFFFSFLTFLVLPFS